DAAKAPHPAPAFPLPRDCWQDDRHLLYNTEAGTGTHLVRLDVSTGMGSVLNLADEKDQPGTEAKSLLQRLRRREQLTPPANLVLKDRRLAEPQVVRWKNDEGSTIEGVLTPPPDGVAMAPYRLVVYPHGGPHSRATLGFDFTVQVLAAQGYAVFQPNFRGSAG